MTAPLPPLSLYLHFPWCVSKCPYCDFNSHAVQGSVPVDRYVDTLLADLSTQLEHVGGREIVSVFMGGGTPSLFPPAAIGRLLASTRALLSFAEYAEITLEANPGSIERGRFAEYRAAGITRVSLGAQSFDADLLKTLGRIHSPDETRRAAEELHAAGLENFNLDLMYALPSQTVAGAVADVEAALALEPAHLSHYQLTLEPGTLFAARPPKLPDDDQSHAMLAACHEPLAARGFERYEVSGYARAGRRCRHNVNYWTFGDYLGVGAGAHGKLSFHENGALVVARTAHLREPRRYLGSATSGVALRRIAANELPFEFAMNALRLPEGFARDTFEVRTGLPWTSIRGTLEALHGRGLVHLEEFACRPTARGLEFLNDVLVEFLPESQAGAGS